MGERVFLIHGWSVTETTTYQALHLKLAENGFVLQDIFLGRYVSLENEVEIRDLARALHRALDEKLRGDWSNPFHIITHSTGALVAREWIMRFYRDTFSRQKPLQNVVFLAGPHFGSRLAHHGRSMLAHALYFGATGRKILTGLELGSVLTWELAEAWLAENTWRAKGIRFYNLTGDRIENDIFKSKIFPAGFEEGSDMVVRAAAANLNFSLIEINGPAETVREVGRVDDQPFGAFSNYVHSGSENGIMNSIEQASTPETHESLAAVAACLRAKNDSAYKDVAARLAAVTRKTRQQRNGFAQLVFRFRDETGMPVDDYVFSLGYIDQRGVTRPSRAVVDVHKNTVTPNFFTVFIKMKDMDPDRTHFFKFDVTAHSKLFSYQPDPLLQEIPAAAISRYIMEDRTTLFDVIFSRQPSKNLFVFHRGDDPDLHVAWNRQGKPVRKNIKTK